MNKTKIIIGAGILIGAAGVAYLLVKRSQQATDATAGSSSGSSGAVLPSAVSTPATSTPRVSKYPEGTLLRAGSSDPVYVIDAEGYRHWVTSRAALTRMGLNIADTKSISVAEMEAIPRLQNISGIGTIL